MPDETLNTADLPALSYASSDSTSDTTVATVPSALAAQRYQLLAEIAHGGMGLVYRAIDTALSREVAVKVLQNRYALESGIARRFADEAQIAAQLQHPAIPPIHDLGTLPDGRPFLAMKLIKGQTLADLLAARTDPSVERGRFVAVFEQVCQAVAYAHAHHVIHRDLKPANVMVGAYGEVQLMDWGLAKVLGARPSESAEALETRVGTEVVSLRDSDGLFTHAGSVLGTPAFMPPEQAIGAIAKVDQRSDVFGLGAILTVILTGQPPFIAASAETARVKAAQGDVSECLARLDNCGAEPELVALCKRCLSPRAYDRPANAAEVATAVAGLRQEAEERARAAELERVRADSERVAAELRVLEQRKRRRAQRALAMSVGLLLMTGLAFGWWQAEQRRVTRERRGRNAEAVTGLLDQCEHALRSGDTEAAAMTLEAARKRYAEGGADKEAERLTRCQDDLAVLRDLDSVDHFRWAPVQSKYPDLKSVAVRYREVLGRFGADPDTVGVETAAARVASSFVRERLVTALDRLLRARKSALVRTTLQSIDPDPFRGLVRDAARTDDTAALDKLAGQAEALEQPPGFTAFLSENDSIKRPERQRALLRAAVQRSPRELGLLMSLGTSYPYNERDGAEERVRWFQAAVAAAPANYSAHNLLGLSLADNNDVDGAIAAFQQAIRQNPYYAWSHNNLGVALRKKGNVEGAIAACKEALRLDPTLAYAHNNLALALRIKGDIDRAIAACKEAIRLDPNYAFAHNNLGLALKAQGDVDGAIAAYKEAIRLEPNHDSVHNNLGIALDDKGDLEGAIAAYKEAIRIDPKYAFAHNNLGLALSRKGDIDGAVAACQEAVRLDPSYVRHHNNLGWALQTKGDLEGAIAAYKDALQINPHNSFSLRNLPRAQRMRDLLPRLADVLAGKDKPKSLAEACELANLCAQPFQKRYTASVRLYEAAFTADPKLAADVQTGRRYDAACSAALAGCGKGKDADERNDKDRVRLREQALAWLRADLVLRRRQAASEKTAQRQEADLKLSLWLKDTDLKFVRPGPERTPMTEEEAAAWDKLWADVKATIALAQKTPIAAAGK